MKKRKMWMVSGFLALSLVFSTVLISFAAQEDDIRQLENSQVSETMQEEPLFNDMQGHWSEAAVNRLARAGILNGYPDGTFKPGALVTRAEVAKIISLAFELEPPIQVDYPDVQPDDWFAPYIGLADPYMPEYAPYESGRPYTDPYIKNYDFYTSTGEKFLPQQADLRMFLAETLSTLKASRDGTVIHFPEYEMLRKELTENFIDGHFAEEISDPYGNIPSNKIRMEQYCWAAWKLGIFEGDDNHWYGPMEPVSRAALAVTVDRVLSGENPSALEVFPLPKDPVLPEINGTGAIQETSMKSYQSIQQMCDEADDIVIADVVRTNENIIYNGHVNIAPSEVTIRESYLGKMKKGDTICIEETGIRQPEGNLAVDGVPLLGENMRVLLFLTEPSSEVQGTKEGYGILGVYQGKFFIDKSGGIHSGAEYSELARLSDPLQEQLDLCGTYGDLATLFPVIVNPDKHL